MKDSFGNSFTKTLATLGVAATTAVLFITTAIASGKLGGLAAYLPIAILLTSSLSISAIWLFGRPRKSDSTSLKNLRELETRVEELEARIHNAEVVDAFENRLAEKEVNQRFRTKPAEQQSHTPTLQQ
ncbi:hypothetical protein ACFPK9_08070 [Rubritalea spongiae]|uniref:Uncharacterized protein n=1 Tax=Rubritalea spongiae TaxID=430797 RepID=A0ABW5E4D4_9BACT